MTHNFLLRYYARTHNDEARDMVLATLRAMAQGGMHDQLGGGFHRYSVDERWFVPHFEKMLYDQAQLAISYLEAYQITHDAFFAGVARRIFDYVLRDMTDRDGGFYSAEDADSAIDPAKPDVKGEGAFYVWTHEEIEHIAGEPAAAWFSFRYGVAPHGNVQDDPHSEFTGKNILYQAHTVEETARHFSKTPEEMGHALAAAAEKLLAARRKRARPHLDDKVLTAWNGLMISAFAKGGAVLSEPRYSAAATRAAEFTLSRMYDAKSGVLLRRYRQGDAAIPGFLDDYALFTQALLDLYETEFDIRYLQTAVKLATKQSELFEDKEHGGFFSTAAGDASLLMRMKDDYDGAEPSGNSVAALNLLRLAQMTDRPGLPRLGRENAERLRVAHHGDADGRAANAGGIRIQPVAAEAGHPGGRPRRGGNNGHAGHPGRNVRAPSHRDAGGRGFAPDSGRLSSRNRNHDPHPWQDHRLRVRKLHLQAAHRRRGKVRRVDPVSRRRDLLQ